MKALVLMAAAALAIVPAAALAQRGHGGGHGGGFGGGYGGGFSGGSRGGGSWGGNSYGGSRFGGGYRPGYGGAYRPTYGGGYRPGYAFGRPGGYYRPHPIVRPIYYGGYYPSAFGFGFGLGYYDSWLGGPSYGYGYPAVNVSNVYVSQPIATGAPAQQGPTPCGVWTWDVGTQSYIWQAEGC